MLPRSLSRDSHRDVTTSGSILIGMYCMLYRVVVQGVIAKQTIDQVSTSKAKLINPIRGKGSLDAANAGKGEIA